MKTYKHIFFIGISLLINLKLIAQTQVVFQESTVNSFLFNNSSTTNKPANFVIKKLAEGNNKSPFKTEFNLNFKQNLRITKVNNNHTLSADIHDFEPVGDVFYKGFSVRDEITPTSVSYKLDVLDKNNALVKKYAYNNLEIKNRDAQMVEETFVDTLNRDLHLVISSISFGYFDSNFNNLIYKTNIINDYYMSDATLTNALQFLQMVNPMDVDNLPMQQATLENAENLIFNLNSKKIQESLPLQDFDPLQYNLKLNTLQNQAIAKRNAINHSFATMHETFYNRGLESLANNQILIAQKWFTRALEVNPNFAPAMLQLAKIDFANGNLNDAESRVRDIFVKMNADPQTEQYSTELADKIAKQYTALGAEQNQKTNYLQAINHLQRAKSLCQSIPGLLCSDNLAANFSIAKNGVFTSLVKEATASLNAGKIDVAENKINEALFYQKENSQEITSTSEADAVMQQIKQISYNKTIVDAKQELKNKNHTKALQLFNTAAELQKNYNLKSDVLFAKLRAEAAKPVLISKTESAINLANANNLDKARNSGKEIETQQQEYGLSADKDLNKQLDKLQSIIFSQECANAQKEINVLHEKALKASTEKTFIIADEFYTEAESVMANYPMCKFTNIKLKDEHLDILPGATYQKLLIQVIELQDSYRYKEAIDKYNETEKYFYSLDVPKLGLQHLNLFDFAVKKGNEKWQIHLAQYFLDKKDLEKSLAMCKVLLDKNVSPKKIKYTLYDLGKALGERDKKNNPAAKAKVEVVKYTANNSNLKMLKKGYLKAF